MRGLDGWVVQALGLTFITGVFAFAFTTRALGAEAPTASTALNVQEALKLALEHAPDAQSAALNARIKELEAQASLSVLLPQLDFSTSLGLEKSDSQISTLSASGLVVNPSSNLWTSDLSLKLSENLYDNGESWTRRKIAITELRRAGLELAQSRDATALAVLQAFYDYSQAQRLVAIQSDQLSTYHKQFSQVSEQYREGMRTKQDYLRFKSQTQRAEVDVVTAQTNAQNAALKILEVTGLDKGDELLKIGEIAPRVPAKIVDTVPSLSDTRDFKIAELALKSNELTASLARRKRWPQLLLSAGASYENVNFVNSGMNFRDSDQANLALTATLKWNLWDWGLKNKEAEIAEATRVTQDMQSRKELLQTQTALGGLATELDRLDAAYKLQRELLNMEKESQDLLSVEYRQGRISFLDLSQAQADYVSAQVGLLETQYAVMNALARLSFYKGTLYDSLQSSQAH
jgi:outer membrane protein TolC